jgi:hypothetical protein
MASTYNYLGIELMATGENAGTWGTKTNTNLNIIQQAASGYHSQSIAGGAQTTALLITDGDSTSSTDSLTNAARNVIIELTGTITGNQIVTIPNGTEKFYLIKNTTSGAYTVQIKGASDSGSGTTFTATEKDTKLIYINGQDVTNVSLASPPGGSDTQVQFNNSGSFGGSANLTFDGSNLSIAAQGDLRLLDTTGGEYVALQAPGTVASNVTLTLPADDGNANDFIQSDGSGVLSFQPVVQSVSWQAVITADPGNAVAGRGYFADTTSGAFSITLPTSASIGNEIAIVDYAGTFDSNNLTVARNGHKIQGATSDLVVNTERAAFTLVYVDATQGWLLKNN